MEKRTIHEWKKHVEPALLSKESEFKQFGYQDVNADDIWNCLINQVWKKDENKRLYEIIQDIFHLKAGTYMNYIRIHALHAEKKDLMSSIRALTE